VIPNLFLSLLNDLISLYNGIPWASKKEAEHRILPITLEDTNGNLAVKFDVF